MLVVAVALIMHAWSPGDAPSRPAIVAVRRCRPTANVNRAVTGVVRDPVGGIIAGATIVARAGGHEQQTVTDADGRFAVSIEPGIEVVVTVRASGFAEATRTIRAGTGATGLEFVLGPERITEAVTVTATRGERRTSDVPASVNVLGREDIKQSPAVVADDVLRQIPTFSLFRRTSSLASHPTAQGVSLRGIGPSGVSRTLVLLDGVPFNDPFGGWVYWSRVPLETAERIEVVDGSSSSLYGNYAMGGVINIVTNAPTRADGRDASRSTAAATRRRSTSSAATYGASSASRSTATSSTPTATRSSAPASAAASTTTRRSTSGTPT